MKRRATGTGTTPQPPPQRALTLPPTHNDTAGRSERARISTRRKSEWNAGLHGKNRKRGGNTTQHDHKSVAGSGGGGGGGG